jgi:hypothetical protein
VIPPPRAVVDLSQFGPKDATVVQLPAININVSHPVEVLRDPPKIRVSAFLYLVCGLFDEWAVGLYIAAAAWLAPTRTIN